MRISRFTPHSEIDKHKFLINKQKQFGGERENEGKQPRILVTLAPLLPSALWHWERFLREWLSHPIFRSFSNSYDFFYNPGTHLLIQMSFIYIFFGSRFYILIVELIYCFIFLYFIISLLLFIGWVHEFSISKIKIGFIALRFFG